MTIDERLVFLLQSTESLHASVHELHGVVQQHTKQVEQHTKQLEIDAENIRRLANIAQPHEQRIDDLESGPAL
jgi:uncharacterized protein Yka (UPF0111/DUF47 family)